MILASFKYFFLLEGVTCKQLSIQPVAMVVIEYRFDQSKCFIYVSFQLRAVTYTAEVVHQSSKALVCLRDG